MAARAISTRTISFGLVSIPVKIYSTNQTSEQISFRMLHKKCNTRLKQQLWCPKDEEVVDRDDVVKGYEFAKDQFVVMSDEEIEGAAEQAHTRLDITEFVPLGSVDPVIFDTAYYLGPDKGGERAYKLLGESLKQTGLCAVARYAARGKQYLVLLRPLENGLVMQQLRYPHEIKAFSEVPIPESPDLKKAELQLALQLIEASASTEFHPENYKDEVYERLNEVIEAKVQGHEVTAAPAEPTKARVIDLMEALKASLAGKAKAVEGDEEGEAEAKDTGRKPAKRSPRKPAAGEGEEEAGEKKTARKRG